MILSKYKFTTKLSLFVGVIAAVASITVSLLVYYGSVDIIFQDALERLKYETRLKAQRLTSDIKNIRLDVQYLAGMPPILGIPRAEKAGGIDPVDNSELYEWKRRLSTIFYEILRAKPAYQQIRYIKIDEDGLEIVRVERHGLQIRITPKNELQNKGGASYIKKATNLQPGDIYISEISLNREHGKVVKPHTPVMRIGTPVFFEDKLYGLVIINMDFSDILNEVIISTELPLTPYVTDERGYFLAHPDRSKTFGFDLGHESNINDVHSVDDHHDKFFIGNDIRSSEFIHEDESQIMQVVKARFDPDNSERFFGVVLSTSRENLLSKSISLRNQTFIIIVVLVILSLILAFVLASRVIKPLHKITKASEDLAEGRAVKDLPVNLQDEIGELARSFDYMRLQLEDKEAALLESQAIAHHANKLSSLGEMASGMAHEINNPMQVIRLVTNRIRRSLEKRKYEDIPQALDTINKNIEDISSIIESLRNLARDSSTDDFKKTSLDIIADDVLGITKERYKIKQINLSVEYNNVSENTIIECQRIQIAQIIINLLNNAYYAIGDTKDPWIILAFNKSFDPDFIEISVVDSGHGISQDVATNIFNPMFTTKEIGEGTGLGLSISSSIAKHHKGSLVYDSESTHTRFVLRIPVSQQTSKVVDKDEVALRVVNNNE